MYKWPPGYSLGDEAGIQFPASTKDFFSSPKYLDWLWGPTNRLLMGTGGFLSPGVK
jgi:hypothetical protein